MNSDIDEQLKIEMAKLIKNLTDNAVTTPPEFEQVFLDNIEEIIIDIK